MMGPSHPTHTRPPKFEIYIGRTNHDPQLVSDTPNHAQNSIWTQTSRPQFVLGTQVTSATRAGHTSRVHNSCWTHESSPQLVLDTRVTSQNRAGHRHHVHDILESAPDRGWAPATSARNVPKPCMGYLAHRKTTIPL